ncbi:SH3 domain-containing protein [Ceratocystis lukuohia]|uniref:SH3 domain-containing protein n=2 Tax=Ceratocystis TaxID=5157 RepID=A0A0F8BRJ0_CERFI|nr:SH3 domain-containing protein [Ceratocystis platani]
MGLHNPLPSSLSSECKKCGKILSSFVDPRQSFGPDKIIPASILARAQGLAILTVIKAGFLGSARFGSGLVVARLPNGSWSAPSAIATAGAGFGGQVGFEITDFVFILNDSSAVRTFAQAGSLTLGGNVSIAAGPIGRNAEAAGAASLKGVAGVFAYSKTKGLFAGVSLEGSAIIERSDANEKLYGQRLTAMQLLTGAVPPPPQAAPLMNMLSSRIFAGAGGDSTMYNENPNYDYRNNSDNFSQSGGFNRPSRASTWQDPIYDRPNFSQSQQKQQTGVGANSGNLTRSSTVSSTRDASINPFPRTNTGSTLGSSAAAAAARKPAPPKPNLSAKSALMKKNEAVAMFSFEADQPGDLGFKKGDVITVLKKTDSDNDWWTGMIGNRHGIFPSNYVKMME